MRRISALPVLVAVALIGCSDPPSADGVAITPEAPRTLDTLQTTVGAIEGKDVDAVSLRYRWTRDDAVADDVDDSPEVGPAYTRKGQVWRVEVSPVDSVGTGTPVTDEVTILNTPPVTAVNIEPAAPLATDAIVATFDSTDADKDAITEDITWFVNGSATGVVGATLRPERTSKGESWELVVVPNDGEEDGEEVRIAFTIGNSAPSAATATVLPGQPNKSDTLTCEGTGWSDADDDDEGYETKWFVNDAAVGTDATLAGASLVKGQLVVCELTPFDGDDRGEPVRSDAVSFGNALPTVASVVIGPEEPLKTDEVSATIEGVVDLDEDDVTLHYRWLVNGKEAGTSEVLTSSRYVRNDKILLEITPEDTVAKGTPVLSNELTAGNNAPTIDAVALAPDPVFTDDLLVASVTADDEDGDTLIVNYAWYVEGTKSTTTTEELDGATEFDKGQEVYVVVSVSDGALSSDSLTSSTLTVSNSLPSAPELVADPAEPLDGEEVVCDIDVDSVDADLDKVTYAFSWKLNGSSMTDTSTTNYANDTANKDSWKDGDSLECTVLPSDGTASGASSTIDVLGITPPCDKSKATIVTLGARSFVFCDDPMYYDAAEAECASMGSGWHLASVQSVAENTFIYSNVAGALTGTSLWIGLSDEDKEGTWVWKDGSTATYRNWGKSEPNGTTAHNGLMYRGSASNKGDWNDIKKANNLAYVCAQK